MAATDELDATEPAGVPEFADVEILAAPDDGLHHHVFLPALLAGLHDLPGLLEGGAGGHGAGDVLAGAEGGDRLRGVEMDGRVDVDRIDLGVPDQVLEALVALFHPERLPDGIQLLLRALADGVHVRQGMPLVDGDEFGTEAESDDRDVQFAAHDGS